MRQHLIYCGLQSRQLDVREARQLVNDLAMEHFPNGHTIHEATGRWAGVMVQCNEPTMIVEVWEANGFGTPPLGKFVSDYKNQAAQESVVMISRDCEAVVF